MKVGVNLLSLGEVKVKMYIVLSSSLSVGLEQVTEPFVEGIGMVNR